MQLSHVVRPTSSCLHLLHPLTISTTFLHFSYTLRALAQCSDTLIFLLSYALMFFHTYSMMRVTHTAGIQLVYFSILAPQLTPSSCRIPLVRPAAGPTVAYSYLFFHCHTLLSTFIHLRPFSFCFLSINIARITNAVQVTGLTANQ